MTTIPALTVDDLTSHLGGPRHIKIDVEGHEAQVLRGMAVTFRRFSPLLFLELHSEMVKLEGGDANVALDKLRALAGRF